MLMAPSKTYNVPGLACAFAVIADADLRERCVKQACFSLDRFLAEYRPDGACNEGAHYWTKAGGSLATAAYRAMHNAVLVEAIEADAGLDIGQTLIGMHLRRVAVPVRLSQEMLGRAIVTAARTRPRLIGGERAKYTPED